MDRNRVLQALFVLWLAGIAWSAWSILGMAPTGDGLVRGFNRIVGFVLGQAGAAFCAVIALIVGWKSKDPRGKWLARAPAVLSLAIVLAIAGLVMWTRTTRPDPQTAAPGPATAPAAPAVDAPLPPAD